MFTEYSLWWLIPIIVFSSAIAWLAYFYTKNSFSKKKTIVLFTLRLTGIFLLLFLLLNPIVRKTTNVIEKPIVVIAQDNSSSIVKTKDSSFYKNEYINSLINLSKSLNKDFDTKIYSFGSETKEISTFDFKDYQTDITQVLNDIQNEYFDQNLAAIILASDGINNYGNNPLNVLDKTPCPIYTIALGDTNKKTDVSISNLRFNEISYTEDLCPLEISIKAKKAKNEKIRLSLLQKGKNLFSKEIHINEEEFSVDIHTNFTPLESGIQTYTVSLSTIENEVNKENNKRDFFVKVLDSRKNITFLSAAPHPDISAIKQSINKNKNYKLTTITDFDKLGNLSDINLVVAHQLPDDNQSFELLKKLQESSIPILYIIGKRTNFNLFNKLNNGINITTYNKDTQIPTLARYNTNFSLFTIDKSTIETLSKLPPLTSPLAKFNISQGIHTFLYQTQNSIKTDNPLISFNNQAENKSAIICGEDIWKWRLRNYMHNNSTKEVDEILQKTIQYLVSDNDKSLFKIRHENIYNQGQKIELKAELYNQSYQLINTAEVKISLKNEKGDSYDYIFSKTHNAYSLEISELNPGKYNFTAKTNVGGIEYTAKGSFIVSTNELETIDLIAKHDLLYTIAVKTNGQMVEAKEINKLSELIKKQEDAKPLIHEIETNHKLINSILYWILIILCFSSEWFLRKFWGKI